ncbi:MAG: ABC transporter permease [Burkholderiaceae bacterium]|nr:ABC transporter permease [Burkholderiaceae bacterium]
MAGAVSGGGDAGKLPTLVFMAWRNVWRNPVRSLLTVGALAGSLVLLVVYLAMMAGMSRQMVEHATDMSVGHLQVQRKAFIDDQDLYATLPWPYLERLEAACPGAKLAPRMYASALASSADASNGVLLKAIDPIREPRVSRLLAAVRGGSADLAAAAPTAGGLARFNVLIGAQLAKNMKLDPGDELILVTQAADASIGNALYRVAGVLRPVDPGFDRSGVLMSIEAFRALMVLEDGFHELSVRLDDVATLGQAQAAFERELASLNSESALDALGGRAVVRNWRQVVPAVADMLQLYGAVVWVIGLIVVALASLGMLNTMLMAIHERTREFGLLRAIGMNRGWLLAMVLIESLFLAIVSALAGSALGLGLVSGVLRDGIDLSANLPDGFDFAGMVIDPVLRMHLEPIDLVYACLLVIGVTMVAALVPSLRVVRVRPAESMR